MNVDKLRELVKEKNIYVKENDKNLFCKCFLCGDHVDEQKKDHLRISKNPELPIYHCFFCNKSGGIRDLIERMTGSEEKANLVITKDEVKKLAEESKIIKSKLTKWRDIKIPELDLEMFSKKTEYIKRRLCTQELNYDLLKHNLIFDVNNLMNLNAGMGILNDLKKSLIDNLHENYVGFISHNKSKIFFRCIDSSSHFKFFKYDIQNNIYDLLDYVSFKTNKVKNNTIVLSEGIFNILACMTHNILNLTNEAFLFASCQSFSYESALKSICFDESLYGVNVIILSDMDKPCYCYNKLIKNTDHIVENIKLYYNKDKKDFGTFPICPVLFDYKLKKVKNYENYRV